MHDDTKMSLAKVRYDKAEKCCKDAVTALHYGAYSSAVDRSYFSTFHGMRALLTLESIDTTTHSEILAAFRQQYIETGRIPAKYTAILESAFEERNRSDYDDFYVVSKTEATKQVENAEQFLNTIKAYIESL